MLKFIGKSQIAVMCGQTFGFSFYNTLYSKTDIKINMQLAFAIKICMLGCGLIFVGAVIFRTCKACK